MYKKITTLCLCVIILMTACGAAEAEEPVFESPVSYMHQPAVSYTWSGISFDNLFPASSYEESGESLNIFPYYNNDSHITVRKILISGNDFWDNVIKQYTGTDNIRNLENYSYVTNASGMTVGYYAIDDKSAYIVSTDTLPSGYVETVLSYIHRASVY